MPSRPATHTRPAQTEATAESSSGLPPDAGIRDRPARNDPLPRPRMTRTAYSSSTSEPHASHRTAPTTFARENVERMAAGRYDLSGIWQWRPSLLTRKETNFNCPIRHVLLTRNHPTRRPNLLLCKSIHLCKWSIVYPLPDRFSYPPERLFALFHYIGGKLLFFGLHNRS